MVLVDSSFSHDWSSRVISDDITGARKATEYLLSLGHQKIMHITNDLDRGFSRERHDGYCTAMDAAGLTMHKNICIIDSNLELTDRIQSKITDSLLNYKPTAIFCGSDPIAMKVIIVASMLKRRIPEDLSIVGYAGLDISQITNPPLTTIKQDFEEMGLKAAKVLFDEINGCKHKRQIKLPVELIIRKSTLSISK
jgi:LacI family transcriptional regulator